MIVYRAQDSAAATEDLIVSIDVALRREPDHSAIQDLLISYGEFEAAAMDALMPDRDGLSPEVRALRNSAEQSGLLFEASRCDEPVDYGGFERAFAAVRQRRLPGTLRVTVPEGYAFYGLFPEAYSKAARRFATTERPRHVCVIGIRSIGTSLSVAVAAALQKVGIPVWTCTVRPHGHPFDRELRLTGELRDEWRRWAAAGSQFAVVDEGPGLSGSSFLAVTSALNEIGIGNEQIVLFPSWAGNADSFVNDRARETWPRYRKYVGDPEPLLPPGPIEDLSAGLWRERVPGARDIPSQPQHEALKYLAENKTLLKFSGLGRHGREKLAVAQMLADTGFSPRAFEFDQGFIEFDFVPGKPLVPPLLPPDFVHKLASYTAFRAQNLRASERSVGFDGLLEMMEQNAKQGSQFRYLRREFENRPAILVDGRMMPHEWIETAKGPLKTDSVDHCRDHFYPGHADPAWDLAATAIEFELNPGQRGALIERYRKLSGDRVSPAILNFYEAAYAAFRTGYSALAAQATTGTPDHDRFGAMQGKYAGALAKALSLEAANQQVIA